MTFIFVSVIFQTAAFGKAGNLAPVAIGFTLAACISWAIYRRIAKSCSHIRPCVGVR